jgi:hypothetical protein
VSTSQHFRRPVIYMSRRTTREVWSMLYGTEPDLTGDLRYGLSQIPVLFDDRMEFGAARIEEDPRPVDAEASAAPTPPQPTAGATPTT